MTVLMSMTPFMSSLRYVVLTVFQLLIE